MELNQIANEVRELCIKAWNGKNIRLINRVDSLVEQTFRCVDPNSILSVDECIRRVGKEQGELMLMQLRNMVA